MKQARIAVTNRCNFSCDYCIMKQPETFDTFRPISRKMQHDYVGFEKVLYNFDQITITGGEPLLEFDRVLEVMSSYKSSRPDGKIFLYSNCELMDYTKIIALNLHGLNGLNFSVHGQMDPLKDLSAISSAIDMGISVRVWINSDLWNSSHLRKVMSELRNRQYDIRLWEDGDNCLDADNESRILLID